MRDWMDLFIAGQPQYVVQEIDTEQGELDEERPHEQLNELRHQLLNETDFEEYKVNTLLKVINTNTSDESNWLQFWMIVLIVIIHE